MTITPVAAHAVPPPSGGSPAGAGRSAGQFDALVRQHLSRGSDDPGDPATEVDAAIVEATSGSTAVRSDGLAVLLAGMLTPAGDGAAAGAGSAGASGPSGAAAEGTTDAAAVASSATALAGTATGGVPTTAVAPSPEGGPPGSPLAAARPLSQGILPDGSVVGSPEAPASTDTAAAGAPSLADGTNLGTALTPDALGAHPSNTAADAAGVAGLAGAGSTTSADRPGAAEPAAGQAGGSPVTDQVFGQVTRLVSRGDGMHRLTLRLHPADLGEVKVVMTVKDGVVDVTLSAGAAAREALRDGSPQLRSLLELAGATSGQLVVRELSSTGGASLSSQPGSQHGQQHDQQPGHAAGERDGSSAAGTTADGGDGTRSDQDGPDGNGPDGSGPDGNGSAVDGVTDRGSTTRAGLGDPAAGQSTGATGRGDAPPGPAGLLVRPRLDLDL